MHHTNESILEVLNMGTTLNMRIDKDILRRFGYIARATEITVKVWLWKVTSQVDDQEDDILCDGLNKQEWS